MAATVKSLSERLVVVESMLAKLVEQVGRIEIELSDKERLSEIEKKVSEIGDQALALGIKLEECRAEWPTPAESVKVNKSVDRITGGLGKSADVEGKSCRSILEASDESVLVLGDSLARGVGDKLRLQCGEVFSKLSRGGAKIETLSVEALKLKDDSKRHLVVIGGTNNLENEDSDAILRKYEEMLDDVSKIKHRKVTVVGIAKRYDLTTSFETKRIVINMKLRAICKTQNVEYLEYEPERSRMSKDKLHFNEQGENEFACKIFKHCVAFLH